MIKIFGKSLTASCIKLVVNSFFLGVSFVGARYTIVYSKSGIFSGETQIITLLIRLSLIVLTVPGRVISARRYLSFRGISLIFAAVTALFVVIGYVFLDQSGGGLLKVMIGTLISALVFLLIFYKRQAFSQFRKVSSIQITKAGVGVFSLGAAALGSLMISVGMMTTPLTCERVYDWYDTVVQSPLVPIRWSQQSLETIGEQSVFSLLHTIKNDQEENESQQQLQEDPLSSSSSSRRATVEQSFLQAKQSLIDTTLEQRSVVTQNVCELVLTQIDKIRKTTSRNVSIVVLLFLILSPLVTVWFRLVSLVSWTILKILMVMGLYKKKQKVVTVTELE